VISFERSVDYDLIRKILTHEKIWPFISDDFSPSVEQFQPDRHPLIWYVVARDEDENNELLGLWMFHPQNMVCWEVHTALLPSCWGARARKAALALPYWIFHNTSCRRIVTNVPDTNRLALHFAMDAGMKIYGVNDASYRKNGRLLDQVCLGISAPANPFEETENQEVTACQ